jgi:hypothetical protein
MADNTSQDPKDTTQLQKTIGMPLRLVRGDASPEELAALIAVLATSSHSGDPDPADRHPAAGGKYRQSAWSSPRRMVRRPQPHGPGRWRASARSR